MQFLDLVTNTFKQCCLTVLCIKTLERNDILCLLQQRFHFL